MKLGTAIIASPIRTQNQKPVCIIVLHLFLSTIDLTLPTATTFSAVRLELAQEEAADVAAGVISLHKISPSTFLRQGLDLEEKQ